ncbi:MAG: transcriptional regulator, MarR family [Clostridia bacterium]|jgi:DNA-binding MarR family transcriptional regulator|nr:transcriptional regulator, MarR family [Clostridia bacterium]
MNHDIDTSADAIAMFCRLQMNSKRDIPIRSSEMGALIFTQRYNAPITPLMLSHFFKIAKPSVTSMINSLVKKDYLIKIPSPTDGRSYTVSITQKGIELVESTYNEYFRTMERLKEKMGSKEFSAFIELIKKANNILSEEK